MSSSYENWKYLWPPYPKNAIMPDMIKFYEKKKWWAQVKKNGTCTVLGISPSHEFIAMTRDNTTHKMWSPSNEFKSAFKDLPAKWFVFVGEVLHSKGPDIKDTIYLFDILVSEGKLLSEVTFEERQSILYKAFPIIYEEEHYFIATKKVWIAKNFFENFRALFDSLEGQYNEGLVLKDPNEKLGTCSSKYSAKRQVKCRRTTKNYSF